MGNKQVELSVISCQFSVIGEWYSCLTDKRQKAIRNTLAFERILDDKEPLPLQLQGFAHRTLAEAGLHGQVIGQVLQRVDALPGGAHHPASLPEHAVE